MAKECKKYGCNNPVFGGGYCKYHQYLREDKKVKGIPKRSSRVKVKAPSFGFDSQLQVFKHIYFKARKPIFCPVSGKNITDCMNGPIEIWIRYYAHILPKGKYTYWELNPRNILMVHPDVHQIVDQGTQGDRDEHPDWNWKFWDDEVLWAKKEYKKFCKENDL